ncbi:MAG: hypothetical protein CBD18_06935 [Opitutales bacterium TMED158]|nr:MAG: hypothetical protein CBD18_06935 [Opitutales bacterium TMED158]
MTLSLSKLSKFDFIGVFFLRLGVGALIAFHGFPLLIGGTNGYERLGSAMSLLGIDALYLIFGLASAVLQSVGGLFLILGILTRGMAILLSFIVGLAVANLIRSGTEIDTVFLVYCQTLLSLIALVFIGPGRFSLDRRGV